MEDIRDLIFKEHPDETFTATIFAEHEGIISGAERALGAAEELGLQVVQKPLEGGHVLQGSPVMTFIAAPKQIALAEDRLIGLLAKPSGIATAAKAFAGASNGKFDIVCGSWKKVDAAVKNPYRKAIETGGCRCRMLNEPMVYIDKNYVIMFGDIDKAINAVKNEPLLSGRKIVAQVKGILRKLGEECWMAAAAGADYIYLDTGRIEDLSIFADAAQYMKRVPKLVFGGNVTLDKINLIKNYPVDIVGVGKAIIDAPMLDMKLDVTPKQRKCSH